MSCTYCNILLDELRPFLEINEIIIDLMRFLGVNHGLMGNLEEGIKIFEELLEIVESLNDVENTSKVLLNLSLQNRRLGKKDESLSYGDRAIKILEVQGDELNYLLTRIDNYGMENHLLPVQLISKVLRAKLYYINNELSEAFNLYDQALTLATDLNILRMIDEIKNEQNIITQGMKVWNKLISEKSYVMEQINDEEIINYLSQISLFVSRFSSDNS